MTFLLWAKNNLPKPIFEGRRRQVKPIESIKELPESTRTINLIEPQDYAFPQGYEDYMLEFAVKKYGKLL
jgi:hypothetical protein